MKIKFLSGTKSAEIIKILIIALLFISMVFLFASYTKVKLGALGISDMNSSNDFPTDKMWIFSGDSSRTLMEQDFLSYFYPSSIAFRVDGETYAVLKQKNLLISVYKDIIHYVSEVLGPIYTAQPVEYDEYTRFIIEQDCTIISYENDISAYMLRLCCDRNAVDFYSGQPYNIKKIILSQDENGYMMAYSVDSKNNATKFVPVSYKNTATYPVNSAIISAYTNSRVIAKSSLSFESPFFSQMHQRIAPDIALQTDLQFYEVGIANSMGFIKSIASEENIIKNNTILSVLKNFKMNTGLVRHYTGQNTIHFVENNASLEMSSKGYIMYDGENGGLSLSKIIEKDISEFSVADKMVAATTIISSFTNDILGGNGEILLTDISYDSQQEILKFEFSYSFDAIPFYNLEKASIEIKDNSLIRAYIPTYTIYRNSVLKSALISPEVAFSAMPLQKGQYVSDYKPGYILEENQTIANVEWLAIV